MTSSSFRRTTMSLSALRTLLLVPLLLGACALAQSNNKAGLAWPNGDTVSMGQFAASDKVSWYYTWIADPIRFPADLEFVPMLWGDEESIRGWDRSVDRVLKDHPETTAVMGMNEPDHEGQAFLTPQQGADIWKEHIAPLRSRNIRLGSPGTTSAPAGKRWHQDWQAACGSDCDYDFLVLHHYGWNVTHFINYVTDMHETFNKPVWVTEWACQDFSPEDVRRSCSAEDVTNYLRETQAWMDQTEWIERYAWFGAMKDLRNVNPLNGLLDQNGALNPLGLQYIDWKEPQAPDSSLPRGANANRPPNNSAPASHHRTFASSAVVTLGALGVAAALLQLQL